MPSEIKEKISHIKNKGAHLKNVKFNFHNPIISQFEAFLTRGGKEVSDFIYKMYQKGAYLESWEENVTYDAFYETAKECGLNIDEETTKVYNYDEKLPWDMIDTGINKEWLKNEYKKAKNAQTTVPCETKCSNCGVCTNFKTHKVLDK